MSACPLLPLLFVEVIPLGLHPIFGLPVEQAGRRHPHGHALQSLLPDHTFVTTDVFLERLVKSNESEDAGCCSDECSSKTAAKEPHQQVDVGSDSEERKECGDEGYSTDDKHAVALDQVGHFPRIPTHDLPIGVVCARRPVPEQAQASLRCDGSRDKQVCQLAQKWVSLL